MTLERLSCGSAHAVPDHAADALEPGVAQQVVRQSIRRWPLPAARHSSDQLRQPVRFTKPDLHGSRLHQRVTHNISPAARRMAGGTSVVPTFGSSPLILGDAYRCAFAPIGG